MDERAQPVATWIFLALMGWMAWQVTGLLPTEASLSQVWWSQQTQADGEWWRVITSMFAHAGPLHLGFNALALYSLSNLERQLGTPTFALLFMASGIGGALAHTMTSSIPAVGASGAIFGLLGVLLVLAPTAQLAILGFPMPAMVALMGYLAVVLMVPAFSELAPIAHAAHIGGLIVGMAGALAMAPKQGLVHLGYIGLVFVAALLLVGELTSIQFDQLANTFQSQGWLAVLERTWRAWVALGVIVAAVIALERDTAAREALEAQSREPGAG